MGCCRLLKSLSYFYSQEFIRVCNFVQKTGGSKNTKKLSGDINLITLVTYFSFPKFSLKSRKIHFDFFENYFHKNYEWTMNLIKWKKDFFANFSPTQISNFSPWKVPQRGNTISPRTNDLLTTPPPKKKKAFLEGYVFPTFFHQFLIWCHKIWHGHFRGLSGPFCRILIGQMKFPATNLILKFNFFAEIFTILVIFRPFFFSKWQKSDQITTKY